MRQIKFRGRDTNGMWYYGFYQGSKNIAQIVNHSAVYNVIPETVGQFTNFSDWDYGTEIYEDDVVSTRVRNYVIKYLNGCYWLVNKDGFACYRLSDIRTEIKVLGSIHDNLELL